MPRNPLGAFFDFVLGIAFLALGIIVLGWVVLTNVAVARGFDVAMWAAQHSPIPLPMDPVIFGNRVINSPSIWFIAAFGVMALLGAFAFLRGARLSARPAGERDDGEAYLELKGANPRVGETLHGEIVLASNDPVGAPGEEGRHRSLHRIRRFPGAGPFRGATIGLRRPFRGGAEIG